MPKRAAPDSDSAEEEEESWHCSRCNMSKPVGEFAAWAMRSKNHICRACALVCSNEAYELRNSSLHRKLMARLRKSMHRAGFTRKQTIKLALPRMQELVQRQGQRSILSGISDPTRLTVARWDGSKPWGLTNAVILTYAEAREHNKRSLHQYHPSYVKHVQCHLLLPPATDNSTYSSTDSSTDSSTTGSASESEEDAEDAGPPWDAPVWPPYPPRSLHTRGITSETTLWYLRHWRIMHPTLPSSSHSAPPTWCQIKRPVPTSA